MMTSTTSEYFNAPDADLILRSADPCTDFHVHKFILSLASPFFDHMFQLPQPRDAPELPIVDVAEPAHIIDPLLRFIYPTSAPNFGMDIEKLVLVLHAAVKYDIPCAIESIRKQLVAPEFVAKWPTRVYAIATRYDLEEEAKIASKYTLSVNLVDCPLSEELKYITAFAYHRLLALHQTRAKAAQEVLKIREGVKCMECNGAYGAFSDGPKWWLDFEKRAKEELHLRPTTDVIFSLAFLRKSSQAVACRKCAESMFNSWSFLEELKKEIDELPATI